MGAEQPDVYPHFGDGTIAIRSTVGEGTTVTVKLKALDIDAMVESA